MTAPASPPLPTLPQPDGRHPHFRSYDPPPIADDALEHQRRHITPIRHPSPRAKATADSGRSSIGSCSVSPIDAACSGAAVATVPPHRPRWRLRSRRSLERF